MRCKRGIAIFLCLLMLTGLLPVRAAEYPCSPWARDELGEALALDFVPADILGDCILPITRRDFARIALYFTAELQFGWHIQTKLFVEEYCAARGRALAEPFADAPETELTLARSLGLIQGRSETEYDPDSPITRQEAAVILRRLYAQYGDPEAVEGKSAYADAGDFADWAKEGIDFVTAAGVMQGVGDNRFDPLGDYTVEQCIITFLRLFRSAPVSRLNGNLPPPFTAEETIAILLAQEMAGTPVESAEKTELPGCTILYCRWPGFRQPLEYLYLVYAGGGVRDALSAISSVGTEEYEVLGNLQSWSYAVEDGGSSLILRAEYASGAARDYRVSLTEDAIGDFCTLLTPENTEVIPFEELYRGYGDAITWCVEEGILASAPDGYGPEQAVTRGEFLEALAKLTDRLQGGTGELPAAPETWGQAVITPEDRRGTVTFPAWETAAWRWWTGPMNKEPIHYTISASEEAVAALFPDLAAENACSAVLDLGDKQVRGRLTGALRGDLESGGPAFLFYPEETSGYKDGGLLEPAAPSLLFQKALPAGTHWRDGCYWLLERGILYYWTDPGEDLLQNELVSTLYNLSLYPELPAGVFAPQDGDVPAELQADSGWLPLLFRAGILRDREDYSPSEPVTWAWLAVILYRLGNPDAR